MGVAFQLFARQWDKLYHVLVNPEFELNRNFFYKPKVNERIEARLLDGTIMQLNTDDAVISLVELPLIYLRNKLPLNSVSVKDLISEGQRNIDIATIQSPVTVNLVEQRLLIGHREIKLIPTQLMIYTAFLRLKLKSCLHVSHQHCGACIDCYLHITDFGTHMAVQEMAEDYQKMFPLNPFKKDDLLEKWEDGIDAANVRHHISKINRAIKEQLNDQTLLSFYVIGSVRKYAKSRYGIRVEKEKISIE
jgi:CRISPR-associated protein Csx14